MIPKSPLKPELISLFIRAVVVGAITCFGIKMIVNVMDPTASQRKKVKNKALKMLDKLGLSSTAKELNEHEYTIATDLLDPADIDITFADIAGLDGIIEELQLQVIIPLCYPEYFQSNLRQPPRGVLFHGPPGCGKTMLAKAIAKEANVRFMNLSISALTDKWYGESQKLAQAVFTLALKIQPCIIFIDEIDSFLRSRDSHDHEATAMMKAQFMTLWEGILSSKKSQIVLIGATNRPQDVDKAVLRRMPCMFQIDLPKESERRQILELILKEEQLSDDIDLDRIANRTKGFSGSDLKDLCRQAAMKCIKELNKDLQINFKGASSSSISRQESSLSSDSDGCSSNSNAENLPNSLQSSISSPTSTPRQTLVRAKTLGASVPELRPIKMGDFLAALHAIEHAKSGLKPTKRISLD